MSNKASIESPIFGKFEQVADPITVIENGIDLFLIKYGKYMDQNAIDSLKQIRKAAQKLEKQLL